MSSEQLPALPVPRRIAVIAYLGIASLPGMLFCGLGVVTAVMSLAMAPSARREIAASDGRIGGQTLLKTAAICSWISVILAILGTIAVVAAFTWVLNRAGS